MGLMKPFGFQIHFVSICQDARNKIKWMRLSFHKPFPFTLEDAIADWLIPSWEGIYQQALACIEGRHPQSSAHRYNVACRPANFWSSLFYHRAKTQSFPPPWMRWCSCRVQEAPPFVSSGSAHLETVVSIVRKMVGLQSPNILSLVPAPYGSLSVTEPAFQSNHFSGSTRSRKSQRLGKLGVFTFRRES